MTCRFPARSGNRYGLWCGSAAGTIGRSAPPEFATQSERLMPRGSRIVPWIGTLVLLAATAGCITIPLNQRRPIEYYEVAGEGAAFVYMLRIDGIITAESSVQGIITGDQIPGTVEQVRFQLDRLEADHTIPAALLVRINSPGGTVTASDIIYHELLTFKQRHKIPIVVLMMDIAASGGYYISMAGDTIVAHPTTTTGSLGVIVPAYNFSPLMEKWGVEDMSITSGPMKDLLSPTKPEKAEQRAVIQSVVNDLYQQFLTVVRNGRGDRLRGALETLADGRIYTANQAKAVGLIDRVGYFPEAVEELRRLTGLRQFRVVTLAARPDQGDVNIYMQAREPKARPGALTAALGLEQGPFAPFWYLWLPR
jgi:protease-4